MPSLSKRVHRNDSNAASNASHLSGQPLLTMGDENLYTWFRLPFLIWQIFYSPLCRRISALSSFYVSCKPLGLARSRPLAPEQWQMSLNLVIEPGRCQSLFSAPMLVQSLVPSLVVNLR